MKDSKRGLLVIISGPSGSGKSTIKDYLMNISDEFYYSISATTRPIKEKEIANVDYHFMTREEFQKLIDNDELIEYKPYSDNFYGTLKSKVVEQLEIGKHVILDIEVQGALEVMKKYSDAVSIWLLPPTHSELRERLYKRGRDTAEEIEKRLIIAKEEIKYFYEYDYIVANKDGEAEKAANEILNIINCEKLKTKRNEEFYLNFNKLENEE